MKQYTFPQLLFGRETKEKKKIAILMLSVAYASKYWKNHLTSIQSRSCISLVQQWNVLKKSN